MMTDPIADFINQLKNGSMTKKDAVLVPFSNLKMAIAKVLEREGYVGSVSKKGKKVKKYVEVGMLYDDAMPRIHDVKRISHPSKRVYYSVQDIPLVKHGHGSIIISTPAGVMTGADARKAKVGGEALFMIW